MRKTLRTFAYIFSFSALLVLLACLLLFYLKKDISLNTPFLKSYFISAINEEIPGYNIDINSVKLMTNSQLSKIRIELYGLDIIMNQKALEKRSLKIKQIFIEFDLIDLIKADDIKYSITVDSLPIDFERRIGKEFNIKLGDHDFFSNNVSQNISKNHFKNISFLQINNPMVRYYDRPGATFVKPNIKKININFFEETSVIAFTANLPQLKTKEVSFETVAKYSYNFNTLEIISKVKNFIPSKLFNLTSTGFEFDENMNLPMSGTIALELKKTATFTNYSGSVDLITSKSKETKNVDPDFIINQVSFDYDFSTNSSKVQLFKFRINSNFLVSSSGQGEIVLGKILKIKISIPRLRVIDLRGSGRTFKISNSTFDFDLDIYKGNIFFRKGITFHKGTKLVAEGKISILKKWESDDQIVVNIFDIDPDLIHHFYKEKKINLDMLPFSISKIENLDLIFTWQIGSFMDPTYSGFLTFAEARADIGFRNEEVIVKNGNIDFSVSDIIFNFEKLLLSSEDNSEVILNNAKISIFNLQKTPYLNFKSEFNLNINEINFQTVELIKNRLDLETFPMGDLKNYSLHQILKGNIEIELTDINFRNLSAKKVNAVVNADNLTLSSYYSQLPMKINEILFKFSRQEFFSSFNGVYNQKPVYGEFKKVYIADVASSLRVSWQPELSELKPYLFEHINYLGRGNLSVKANIIFPPNRAPIYRFKADFTEVALSIPSLGFNKENEDFGLVEFGWTKGEPFNFEIVSNGHQLSGLLYLDSKNKIEKVEIQRVKLDPYFFGSATYKVGTLENKLTLRGSLYDYSKAPRSKFLSQDKNLKIITNFSKLILTKDLALNEFSGAFDLQMRLKGSAIAQLNGGPKVQMNIGANNERKYLTVYSDNAGEVLLKSNIYQNGYGGEIRLELNKSVEKDFEGEIQIKGLRVIGAPFLAKLIALSSVKGLLDMIGSNGIVFGEIKARYSLNRDVLTIIDGIAINPSLGLTLSGTREMNNKTINYKGVVSPAYVLNSMVKKIPMIGSIIGGSEGEGVFGINYFATGTIQDPYISVNPLSIIAPGQFRQLLK